ncbi:hypothetical protein DSLASN_30480 [Desulfoluna limicola]|uniref:Uncharacterized protein n=1 Tax=Desulfoluna limicola TaxID=2810562 RepID=A0ABM7PIL8_9BACT|nr:hypothetical protein [Desulfoluna limicola]BCS97416.1 hypothetical protein DSLASN_30480 [Desulfoluna limicola]
MIFCNLFKKKRPDLEKRLAEIKAANIIKVLSWPPKDLAMLYEWSRPIRFSYAHLMAETRTTPLDVSRLPFSKEQIRLALQLQVLVYLTHHQNTVTSREDETLHAIATAYERLALFQELPCPPSSPELAAAVSECIEKQYDALLQLPDNPNTWSGHQKTCIFRLAADIAGIDSDAFLSSTMEAEQERLCEEIWGLIDTLLLAKQQKRSA